VLASNSAGLEESKTYGEKPQDAAFNCLK